MSPARPGYGQRVDGRESDAVGAHIEVIDMEALEAVPGALNMQRLERIMMLGSGVHSLGIESESRLVIVSTSDAWADTTIPKGLTRVLASQAAEYRAYAEAAQYIAAQDVHVVHGEGEKMRTEVKEVVVSLSPIASSIEDGRLTMAFLVPAASGRGAEGKKVAVDLAVDTRLRNGVQHQETVRRISIDGESVLMERSLVIIGLAQPDGFADECGVALHEQHDLSGNLRLLLMRNTGGVLGVCLTPEGSAVQIKGR